MNAVAWVNKRIWCTVHSVNNKTPFFPCVHLYVYTGMHVSKPPFLEQAVLILLAVLAVSTVNGEPGKLKYRPRPRYHPVHLVHQPAYTPVHVVHKSVPVVVHKPVPVVVHKPIPVYHHGPSYGGYHG